MTNNYLRVGDTFRCSDGRSSGNYTVATAEAARWHETDPILPRRNILVVNGGHGFIDLSIGGRTFSCTSACMELYYGPG